MITSRQTVTVAGVADHYDELDAFYREIWGEHVHHGLWESGDETPEDAVRKLVRLVAECAGISTGSRVCDVGCGYGATARMLADEAGAQVTALTISEAQYRHAIAQRNGADNPRYLHCDWLENDLPSASFDAVISIESSEHMMDKPAFFQAANRVLRPGGRLVICAWLSSEDPTPAHDRYLLEPICREGRMPGMGSESDYRQWFATEGFAIRSFEDLSQRVKKTWPICVRRFLGNLMRRPAYLRFLFNQHAQNRVFSVTILRIWLAYELGAMRYGIFVGEKARESS